MVFNGRFVLSAAFFCYAVQTAVAVLRFLSSCLPAPQRSLAAAVCPETCQQALTIRSVYSKRAMLLLSFCPHAFKLGSSEHLLRAEMFGVLAYYKRNGGFP
eukprot:2726912-Rhodomonas_salina.2